MMTPNEVIYQIRLDRKLSKIWKELRREEKKEVLRRLEDLSEFPEMERLLNEIKKKQKWLF